jgi:hypothetical protein
MLYLYLDESGDLGFDFVNKKPSKFFTITILAVFGVEANRQIINAVKKTLRRKLNPKNKRRRIVKELKATHTTIEIKKYLYTLVKNIPYAVYSITLNKRKVYDELAKNKSRVYNFIARQVLDKIPFETYNDNRIFFIVDRSKSRPEITEFNEYIQKQLEGRVRPNVPLEILHGKSECYPGIQMADLFSYGIFQKYENKDTEWFSIFSDKVKYDNQYL